MQIKVRTSKLVDAIKAKKAKIVQEHAAKEKIYAAEFKSYQDAVKKRLIELSAVFTKAKSYEDVEPYLEYNNRLRMPSAPDKPRDANIERYDAALAQLALVEDEFVTLSEKKDADFMELI